MKALIISDDINVINPLKAFIKNQAMEVITYKWLLKALDNIEEISPDVIFVSAVEYPRHWKTLTQYVRSGIGAEKVCIFLYNKDQFTEEEKDKISALGINGTLNDFSDESLNQVKNTINLFFNASGFFILQNKNTKSLFENTAKEISDNTFLLNMSNDISNYHENDYLKNITFYNNEKIINFSGKIQKIDYTSESLTIIAKEVYDTF